MVLGELDSFKVWISGLSIGFVSKNLLHFLQGPNLGAQGTRLFWGLGLKIVYWSFINKNHGSFSEVQLSVLSERNSFGVQVSKLLIEILSKPMAVSPRSELTLLGLGSWCCQLEFYQNLW